MEKQNLPNSTLILVLGILSIITCCCYGVFGLILGIIAVVLANTATKMYKEDPELYSGYGNVKTGKILGIIGIVLSALLIIAIVISVSMYGAEGIQEMMQEWQRELERQQAAQA